MNIFCICQLDDATKYQSARSSGDRREGLFIFSLFYSLSKHVKLGRGHFSPQGHNLIKVGRNLLNYTIYQTSRL